MRSIEKYLNMAKDASASGDIILAENYYQHADHYTRVAAEHSPKEPEPRRNEQPEYNEQPTSGSLPEVLDTSTKNRPMLMDDGDADEGDDDSSFSTDSEDSLPAFVKNSPLPTPSSFDDEAPEAEAASEDDKPKRRRGRPRKADTAPAAEKEALEN